MFGRRVSRRLSRGLRGARRGARHRDDGEALRRRAARRCALYRPLEASPGRLRFKLFRRGGPVTLSDSLPMLEHMGLKVLDERPYRIAPPKACRRSGCTTSACQAGSRRSRSTRRLHAVFEDAFAPRLPRRGRERRLQPPRGRGAACPPRRSSSCARTRSTCGRSASRCRSRSSRPRSPRTPTSRAMLVELFKLRFDPALRRGGAVAGARQGRRRSTHALDRRREPVRGPRAAAIPGADPRDDAHELLAPRRRGAPQARFLSFKFDPSKVPGLPEPQADVRDLRLLDALRGRAPARRQGRARRPALVRSAGGLPHRDPRPGQGADGEEHRDRAGRLEGRIRAEARARRRPTATRS